MARLAYWRTADGYDIDDTMEIEPNENRSKRGPVAVLSAFFRSDGSVEVVRGPIVGWTIIEDDSPLGMPVTVMFSGHAWDDVEMPEWAFVYPSGRVRQYSPTKAEDAYPFAGRPFKSEATWRAKMLRRASPRGNLGVTAQPGGRKSK
jgi:hypothetical protein